MSSVARLQSVMANSEIHYRDARPKKRCDDDVATEFPYYEIGSFPPMRRWPGVNDWVNAAFKAERDIVFTGGAQESAIRTLSRVHAGTSQDQRLNG